MARGFGGGGITSIVHLLVLVTLFLPQVICARFQRTDPPVAVSYDKYSVPYITTSINSSVSLPDHPAAANIYFAERPLSSVTLLISIQRYGVAELPPPMPLPPQFNITAKVEPSDWTSRDHPVAVILISNIPQQVFSGGDTFALIWVSVDKQSLCSDTANVQFCLNRLPPSLAASRPLRFPPVTVPETAPPLLISSVPHAELDLSDDSSLSFFVMWAGQLPSSTITVTLSVHGPIVFDPPVLQFSEDFPSQVLVRATLAPEVRRSPNHTTPPACEALYYGHRDIFENLERREINPCGLPEILGVYMVDVQLTRETQLLSPWLPQPIWKMDIEVTLGSMTTVSPRDISQQLIHSMNSPLSGVVEGHGEQILHPKWNTLYANRYLPTNASLSTVSYPSWSLFWSAPYARTAVQPATLSDFQIDASVSRYRYRQHVPSDVVQALVGGETRCPQIGALVSQAACMSRALALNSSDTCRMRAKIGTQPQRKGILLPHIESTGSTLSAEGRSLARIQPARLQRFSQVDGPLIDVSNALTLRLKLTTWEARHRSRVASCFWQIRPLPSFSAPPGVFSRFGKDTADFFEQGPRLVIPPHSLDQSQVYVVRVVAYGEERVALGQAEIEFVTGASLTGGFLSVQAVGRRPTENSFEGNYQAISPEITVQLSHFCIPGDILCSQGVSGEFDSTAAPLVPPAWTPGDDYDVTALFELAEKLSELRTAGNITPADESEQIEDWLRKSSLRPAAVDMQRRNIVIWAQSSRTLIPLTAFSVSRLNDLKLALTLPPSKHLQLGATVCDGFGVICTESLLLDSLNVQPAPLEGSHAHGTSRSVLGGILSFLPAIHRRTVLKEAAGITEQSFVGVIEGSEDLHRLFGEACTPLVWAIIRGVHSIWPRAGADLMVVAIALRSCILLIVLLISASACVAVLISRYRRSCRLLAYELVTSMRARAATAEYFVRNSNGGLSNCLIQQDVMPIDDPSIHPLRGPRGASPAQPPMVDLPLPHYMLSDWDAAIDSFVRALRPHFIASLLQLWIRDRVPLFKAFTTLWKQAGDGVQRSYYFTEARAQMANMRRLERILGDARVRGEGLRTHLPAGDRFRSVQKARTADKQPGRVFCFRSLLDHISTITAPVPVTGLPEPESETPTQQQQQKTVTSDGQAFALFRTAFQLLQSIGLALSASGLFTLVIQLNFQDEATISQIPYTLLLILTTLGAFLIVAVSHAISDLPFNVQSNIVVGVLATVSFLFLLWQRTPGLAHCWKRIAAHAVTEVLFIEFCLIFWQYYKKKQQVSDTCQNGTEFFDYYELKYNRFMRYYYRICYATATLIIIIFLWVRFSRNVDKTVSTKHISWSLSPNSMGAWHQFAQNVRIYSAESSRNYNRSMLQLTTYFSLYHEFMADLIQLYCDDSDYKLPWDDIVSTMVIKQFGFISTQDATFLLGRIFLADPSAAQLLQTVANDSRIAKDMSARVTLAALDAAINGVSRREIASALARAAKTVPTDALKYQTIISLAHARFASAGLDCTQPYSEEMRDMLVSATRAVALARSANAPLARHEIQRIAMPAIVSALVGQKDYNLVSLLNAPLTDDLFKEHPDIEALIRAIVNGDVPVAAGLLGLDPSGALVGNPHPDLGAFEQLSVRQLVLRKARVSALLSLMLTLPPQSQDVAFNMLASAMSVSEEQVDGLVFEALDLGLIDGSVDCVRGILTLRAVQPLMSLTPQQTHLLATRLRSWSEAAEQVKQQLLAAATGPDVKFAD